MRSRHRKVRGGWHDQGYRPSRKQKLFDSLRNYFRSRDNSKEWQDTKTELLCNLKPWQKMQKLPGNVAPFGRNSNMKPNVLIPASRPNVLIPASGPQNWMPANVLSHSVKKGVDFGKGARASLGRQASSIRDHIRRIRTSRRGQGLLGGKKTKQVIKR